MKARIEIGTRVNGSNGHGTITNIITKSTGYVEVTFDNGKVKKEMAFNLKDGNGIELKRKPNHKPTPQWVLDRNFQHSEDMLRKAYDEDHARVTGHSMETIMRSFNF